MRRGTSLLELLLVLGLILLLAALGGIWWRNQVEALRLRDAAAVLATDLQRARAEARKQSRNWRLAGQVGSGTYLLGPEGSLVPRNLPHGAVFREADAVSFRAPYGTLDVPDRTFVVEYRGRRARVNVVGVTGKVVVRHEP